jgi:dTDP-4-dehydrorhamnose 3,5-epimerase
VNIESTEIHDVKIITPQKWGDQRGFFSETYSSAKLKAEGIDLEFCQDNHSFSQEICTLRGLHFQIAPFAQDKLLRVTKGSIFDVAVDIRNGSPSFGSWVGRVISAELWNQILIPAGFAHGFCTIAPDTEVQYKVSAIYSLENERGIAWNDPDIAIEWPLNDRAPILSDKDKQYPLLSETPSYFTY